MQNNYLDVAQATVIFIHFMQKRTSVIYDLHCSEVGGKQGITICVGSLYSHIFCYFPIGFSMYMFKVSTQCSSKAVVTLITHTENFQSGVFHFLIVKGSLTVILQSEVSKAKLFLKTCVFCLMFTCISRLSEILPSWSLTNNLLNMK